MRIAKDKTKMNILKIIWNWIFDPNFGLGDPKYEQSNRQECGGPRTPHIHRWRYFNTIRHNWTIKDGKPVGKEKYPLDKVIAAIKENSAHTETTLSMVEGWKATGYEFCHVSWTIYRCELCSETKRCECYTAPIKADGTGPIVYEGGASTYYRKFRETTQIPVVVSGRREFAVERMKKYS